MIKKLVRRITSRLDLEDALDIVECVCEEHIPDQYKISYTKTEIVASNLKDTVKHTWEFKDLEEDLLHCFAHTFCADVMIDQKH